MVGCHSGVPGVHVMMAVLVSRVAPELVQTLRLRLVEENAAGINLRISFVQ